MKNGYAVDKCHVSTLSHLWSTRNKSSTSAIFIARDNWEDAYLLLRFLEENRKEKSIIFKKKKISICYSDFWLEIEKKKSTPGVPGFSSLLDDPVPI